MNREIQRDVTVNGQVIPLAAIAVELQHHAAPSGQPDAAWRSAARALVVRTLLLQEARRLGLVAEARELSPGKRETAEEALIRAVIEARVIAAEPGESACRALYESRPEDFRAPTLYSASHILLSAAPSDAGARRAAMAIAMTLLEELRVDPAAFDRLARLHSACPSREAGGRLGQILPGETVREFEAALDRLSPGEINPEPVATRYGLHIVRLDARAEGNVLPFVQVADRIRERLERNAWMMAARRLVAELVAGAEIAGIDLAADR